MSAKSGVFGELTLYGNCSVHLQRAPTVLGQIDWDRPSSQPSYLSSRVFKAATLQ